MNKWSNRRWFVNRQGHTFSVIDWTDGVATAPSDDETSLKKGEKAVKHSSHHRFSISLSEVTNWQYSKFLEKHPEYGFQPDKEFSNLNPDAPLVGAKFYEMAAYCNWLSGEEGLDLRYEPNPDKRYAEGMKVVSHVLSRTGYRLPTQTEWELACRAGATTKYSFGESAILIDDYAIVMPRSKNHPWVVKLLKPNDLGLFDMHGNAWELTQSEYIESRGDGGGKDDDEEQSEKTIKDQSAFIDCGGAYFNGAGGVNASIRDYNRIEDRNFGTGFRIARTHRVDP